MHKPPPGGPSPDKSMVEPVPSGSKPEVRRTLGRLDQEDSVSISAPSQLKKGSRMVPRAAVGARAPSPSKEGTAKAAEVRGSAAQKVQKEKEEQRQRVWDKLDAARKTADERKPRLDRFKPKRGDG